MDDTTQPSGEKPSFDPSSSHLPNGADQSQMTATASVALLLIILIILAALVAFVNSEKANSTIAYLTVEGALGLLFLFTIALGTARVHDLYREIKRANDIADTQTKLLSVIADQIAQQSGRKGS